MNTPAEWAHHDAIAMRQTTITPTRFYLNQLIHAINREINNNPPHQSRENQERRGELDQLRDMIDRRT